VGWSQLGICKMRLLQISGLLQKSLPRLLGAGPCQGLRASGRRGCVSIGAHPLGLAMPHAQPTAVEASDQTLLASAMPIAPPMGIAATTTGGCAHHRRLLHRLRPPPRLPRAQPTAAGATGCTSPASATPAATRMAIAATITGGSAHPHRLQCRRRRSLHQARS